MSSDQIINEVKKALTSANRAQKCHAINHADESLYYINGVQDRLKRLLEGMEAQKSSVSDQ